MIMFINFAPVEFLGGVERRIIEMYSLLRDGETIKILCVENNIANIYGKIVLKREFDNHFIDKKRFNPADVYRAGLSSFLPLSSDYKKIRSQIKRSRIIYMKFELNELFLLTYFGGLASMSKTVAAIRSPLVYKDPQTFFDRFHNVVYRSFVIKLALKRFGKFHVLNLRDKKYLSGFVDYEKIIYIPNGVKTLECHLKKKSSRRLSVIYVGELSLRKGTDILLEIVVRSKGRFNFTIIGDGPMKGEVIRVCKKESACVYLGYISGKQLTDHYISSDVILFPSRAETFGTVMIEAAQCGNVILNSYLTTLSLPEFVEFSTKSNNSSEYVHALNRVNKLFRDGKISKGNISSYVNKRFNRNVINRKTGEYIFEL